MARTPRKSKALDEEIDAIQDIVERGVSGTTNWFGDPFAEQNQKLQGASAYGVAGTRTWGEWEKIGKTDPDVSTVLQFVSSPIRAAAVDVVAAEHPNIAPELAQAQADFVRDQLLGVEPSWPEVLAQGVEGSLLTGFALHEVVLGMGEHASLPGGKGYVLRKLAERLQSSVHPTSGWREAMLEDGSRDLEYVQQQGQVELTGFQTDIRIPADKLLLWTWRRSGQNYRGVSAFRAVWYLAKIREQLLKLIGIALVREGAGIPVASADSNADILTPQQQRKLQRLLANLVAHENASVVMPRGWKMEWIFSGGGDKNHILQVYNDLGQLILRQLGAQQIALGSGETGSRSVGEVHNSVAQSYLQSILEMAHGVLNGNGNRRYVGLSRKLVEPNWGPQPAYPMIQLTLKKPSLKPTERVTAMSQAVTAGLIRITAEDENQLRTELGMSPREIPEGEDPLAPIEAEPEEPETDEETGAEEEAGETEETKKAHRHSAKCGHHLARKGEWKPWRMLRPAEKALNLARIDKFVTSERDVFQAMLKPILEVMVSSSADAVSDAMKDGDPSEIATIPLDTAELEATIARWMGRIEKRGIQDVVTELKPKKKLGAAETIKERGSRYGRIMEAQRKTVVRRIVDRVRQLLEREAIEVIRTRGIVDEVVDGTLDEILESQTLRQDAGLVITKIYNVGRAEAAEALGAEKAEYSAILDDATCPTCMGLDGRVFEIGSPDYEANLPPNRDCDGMSNCRCLYAFIGTKGEMA